MVQSDAAGTIAIVFAALLLVRACFRQGNSCFRLTCTFFSQQKETELSKIKCSGISEKICGISFFIKEKIGVFLAFFGKIEKNLLTKQVEWSIINTSKSDQRIAK